MEIIKDVLSAATIATVSWLFIQGNLHRLTIATSLKKHGVKSIQFTVPSIWDREHFFAKADRIRIMYTSGKGFFVDNKRNQKMIERAIQRGATIQVLLATENSDFVKDIETSEIIAGTRIGDKRISEEIQRSENYLKSQGVEVRHYRSEYRMAMMIADYYIRGTDEYCKCKSEGWLYISLPPYWTKESIILKSEIKYTEARENGINETDNIVEMMNRHFQTIWDKYK